MPVFSQDWWVAAGQRAAYTAIAAVLPLAALLFTGDVSPLYVISLTTLSALASLATSIAGIPEVTEKIVPLWRAILVRTLKTAGQVAAPAFLAVTLLEQVGWYELGVQVAGAVLTTLLRTLMAYLPETQPVTISPGPSLPVHDPGGA